MKRINTTLSVVNGIGYSLVLLLALVLHLWVDAFMALVCFLIAHRLLVSLESEHGKLHRVPEEPHQ